MAFGVTQARGVVATPGGASGLGSTYGSFSDSTTQTGSTTAGTVFTYNTDVFSGLNGVTLVSGSRITVSGTGVYEIAYSCQFSNSDTAPQDVYVWARINGTDVANSNRQFGMNAQKGPSQPSHIVACTDLYLSMTASNYVELVWLPSNTNVTLTPFAASVTPAYPAVPSIIVNINKIG